MADIAELGVVVRPSGVSSTTRKLRGLSQEAKKTSSAVRVLKGVMYSLSAAVSAVTLANLADSFTNTTNLLAIYSDTTEEVIATQKKLFDVSNRVRSDFEGTVRLYSKLLIAQQGLRASSEDMVKFTEAVGQAVQLSGANSISAAGALLQLGQALATGRVYAEEFKSILEGAPRLAKAVADGMEGIDGDVGKLRAALKAGSLTSKQLFESIVGQADVLAKQFDKMKIPISGAFTVLRNNFVWFVGSLDKSIGLSDTLVKVIVLLARSLDIVGRSAIVAGAGVLGFFLSIKLGVLFTAIAGLRAFGVALGATGTVMAVLTGIVGGLVKVFRGLIVLVTANWVGLLVGGVAALVSWFYLLGQRIKPIKKNLADLGDYAAVVFDEAKKKFVSLKDFLSGGIDALNNWYSSITVRSPANDLSKSLGSGAIGVLEWLSNRWKSIINWVIGRYVFMKRIVFDFGVSLIKAVGYAIRLTINDTISFIEKSYNTIAKNLNRILPKNYKISHSLVIPKLQIDAGGANKILKDYIKGIKDAAEDWGSRDYLGEAGKRLLEIRDAWIAAAEARARIAEQGKSEEKQFELITNAIGKANNALAQYLAKLAQERYLMSLHGVDLAIAEERIRAMEFLKSKGSGLDSGTVAIANEAARTHALAKLGKQATDDFRDSYERLNRQLEYYNTLRAENVISENTFRAALTKTYQEFDLVYANYDSLFAKMAVGIRSFQDAFTDSITDFILTAEFNFKKLGDVIVGQLIRMATEALIVKPIFDALSASFSSLVGGSPFTGPAEVSLPGRAVGGNVLAGNSYVVGERGREIFTPNVAGRIIPNNKVVAGNKINVIINNNVSNAKVSQEATERPDGQLDLSVIIDNVESSIAKNVGEGQGPLDAVMKNRYGLSDVHGVL